jgi:hypothetical protein
VWVLTCQFDQLNIDYQFLRFDPLKALAGSGRVDPLRQFSAGSAPPRHIEHGWLLRKRKKFGCVFLWTEALKASIHAAWRGLGSNASGLCFR